MVYILWCSHILKSLLACRDCPCQGWDSQILKIAKCLINQCKPTNPKYTDPATSSNDNIQANISSALNHPGLGTSQLETTPIAQSLLELFQLANPKLLTPCRVETPKKILAHAFPSLWSSATWPTPGASPMALHGMWWLPLSGTCEYNRFLPSKPHICFLLWLH